MINTNLPPISYTVSKLWLIIGQIYVSERRVPHFNALTGVTPVNIAINDISLSLKLHSLAYISAAESVGVSSTTFT